MASNNRHAEITATNHGPLVNVTAWILMCMSVSFTSFRLISNIVLRGKAGKDDCIIVAAEIFAVAQSASTSMMVAHGLGQIQDVLSASDIEQYQQALLASSILYVTALALTRFSMLFFLGRLISVPQKTFRLLLMSTWVLVIIYLVAEIFILSFACDLPATWDYLSGQCLNLLAFWDFDTAFDLAKSILIIALPITIVSPLKMSLVRKLQVVTAFAFQLPPCAFAIIRLVYLHGALTSRNDTWDSTGWQIWTQINLHFSIVATNMPCLKIFLDGFQSVLFRQNMGASIGGQTELQSYRRTKDSKSKSKSKSRDCQWSVSGSTRGMLRPGDGNSSTTINIAASVSPIVEPALRPGLPNDKIYKTTEWTVLGTEGRNDLQVDSMY